MATGPMPYNGEGHSDCSTCHTAHHRHMKIKAATTLRGGGDADGACHCGDIHVGTGDTQGRRTEARKASAAATRASGTARQEMTRNMVASATTIATAVVVFNPLDCWRIRWQVQTG